MTIYDYMCDVLRIEACVDCPNFNKSRWECPGDYTQGDAQCLASLGVTAEDLANREHPNARQLREIQKKLNGF